MLRMIASLVALCSIVGISGVTPVTADPPAKFNAPKKYYLALGDSLAFGFQWSIFNQNLPSLPAELFANGYVDSFGQMLGQVLPGIQTVNFGCVGETTNTFIQGGCLYTAQGFRLHHDYSGSQLDAAAAFLRANPGNVDPITFNLGTNDLNSLV